MNTLFTFSQPFFQSVWLYENVAFAQSGDSIVLLNDAVLALQSPVLLASFLAKANAMEIAVFALQPDIELRGVNNAYNAVSIIGYDALVDLSVQHKKQVAW